MIPMKNHTKAKSVLLELGESQPRNSNISNFVRYMLDEDVLGKICMYTYNWNLCSEDSRRDWAFIFLAKTSCFLSFFISFFLSYSSW